MVKLEVILGIAVAGGVGMILFWACFFFFFHQFKAKYKKMNSLSNEEFVRFDFDTLKSATANFSVSNMLGQGGFGVVYKGTLKCGKEIAVKRLLHELDLSPEGFMTESRTVARIQHPNLVKHLGFCLEGGTKLMVYEFLPNASLVGFLYDPSKRAQVNWETWYKIILGIAKGLEYLHEGVHPEILHHGIKISNVLLDKEMNPKIGDFGMNKLFESRHRLINTQSIGILSYAYIAPEYFRSGGYCVKSDVYSFGVVVLEIVSDLLKGISYRSVITDAHRIRARKLWNEDRLSELIDPALSSRCSETDVIRCIQVGILCIQEIAEHRPTMGEVILMLTGKVDVGVMPHP